MVKEELIKKLTTLYEKGKSDWHLETMHDIATDQNDYILEMAENIINSFQK